MNTQGKISIMPHTHWDREWYFTSAKSLMFSLHNFKEAMDYLKKNEEFKYFLLDGQVSIIDDYIKYYPEDEELIKELVSAKRLIIGPWYTQTDLLVIGGESIVRNLYYGMSRAKKLGNAMMVGYVPDCFGQSAQMPQIYNAFNINKCAFRRGKSEKQIDKSEFYWEGVANSKVFTHNIIDYGNMINPPIKQEEIKEYFSKKIEELAPFSTSNHILLMNGQDQRPIRKDLLEIIDKAKKEGINIEINNLYNTLDDLEEEGIKNGNIPTYIGEFTFGEKSRVHKSIFSTRADLKILNNKTENKLVNIIEPMCTIAYSLGVRYNHKAMEKMWKLMFENAAHDSIGMCNSDTVNKDIESRYKRVNDLVDNLFEIVARLIGQGIPEKDIFQFQVYNYLPYKRSEVIKVTLFTPGMNFKVVDSKGKEQKHHIINSKDVTEKINNDSLKEIGVNGEYNPKWAKEKIKIYETEMYIYVKDVESMGYKTLYFEKLKEIVEGNSLENESSIIENEVIKLKISKEDGIVITDKETGNEFKGFFMVEDSGDDGDTYDYSQPRKDRYYYSNHLDIVDLTIERNSLVQKAFYVMKMRIPKDLISREKDVLDSEIDVKVELTIKAGDKKVDFNVSIYNKAIEHRMRVLFKTEIESEESIADQQFGSIKRPTYLKEIEIWEKEGWVEKPRTIEPMQSFVTLKNKEYGVAILTDCVREYQIVGEKLDTIAVTLFRSVPYMGKGNLLDRPGRASGMEWETPDAKLLKEMNFNFSVLLYKEDKENYLSKLSKEKFTPLQVYQAAEFKNNFQYFILNRSEDRDRKENYSLLEFTKENLVLSAFKKVENKDGYILRVFNGNVKESEKDEIRLIDIGSKEVFEVLLDEVTIKKKLESKENISIDIEGSEFKTLYFN
ncbi:glycoside hydrolase family 38 C-terminal domain-containing protein [Clostridium ganghwense]|uniref:Alpha-mannosidase n=1 Tax=Clostridium ganghwense TaxID=312089 RepID=A0ABT4CPS4_9CLOT|nr:glycoside hydrolase family 38 C-terminal domain-containing protein [Clostridium ganghwense]MCY6371062.1 alpha-mannosidase [Clostridium ganghwense]